MPERPPSARWPGWWPARLRSEALRRQAIPFISILCVLALLLAANDHWNTWISERAVQSTDDAYIHADVSILSARVRGNVLKVLVDDFQAVKAGQALVEIDPADYVAAVEAVQADVDGARSSLDNLKNQQALQRALIEEAEAQKSSAAALLTEMQQELDRQRALLQGGLAGTLQRFQQATANFAKASADMRTAEATFRAQRFQLAVLEGDERILRAKLSAAAAALKAAQLQLGYTAVVAPFDGVVGARLVQEGVYLNVGTNLIAVVPIPRVYVIANFKETQLTHVSPGQAVDISVDSYPGQTLRGTVERLAPASGAVFALLPPDNATGNFTKVVQRIPVRIEFDQGQPLLDRLRAGMSVEARIHVAVGP